MDLVKNELMSDLLGIYGKLLTEYQLEIMELYYLEDLSLKEIADNQNVSRNAIFTLIKRVEKILLDYEDKLRLNASNEGIFDLFVVLNDDAINPSAKV